MGCNKCTSNQQQNHNHDIDFAEGLPDDTVTQLHTGKLHLPFSDQMALPSPVRTVLI